MKYRCISGIGKQETPKTYLRGRPETGNGKKSKRPSGQAPKTYHRGRPESGNGKRSKRPVRELGEFSELLF